MKIDIVIPLYNEEHVIAQTVETTLSFLKGHPLPYPFTITLANNASTDNSWKICQDLAARYSNVKALDIGKKGKGIAIRTAWTRSDADVLVFMDADLSSDLNYLGTLIGSVVKGEADLAIGNRLGKKSVLISHKRTRKFASRSYNALTRAILGTDIEDHQCGFKAMKKSSFMKIAPHLKDERFFIDTELIAFARHFGMTIQSIDITWRDSMVSKVSLIKDSTRMFRDTFALRKRIKTIQP